MRTYANAPRAAAAQTMQTVRVPARTRPLSQPERAHFEPRLGVSLAKVRVHEGPAAAATAAAVGARAFTYRNNVVMGNARTGSARQRLLAHELVHVAQEAKGAAPEGMVHRAPCQGTVRDKGGAGQHIVQDWFYRHDPGGGTWYKEMEVPNGAVGGGTGFADLVWEHPNGNDVYVYEMKKNGTSAAARAQVNLYRTRIAQYCKGVASGIFAGKTIRKGTQNVLPILELPYLDNRQYVDLTVPGNQGVMVYSYLNLAGTATAVGPGGAVTGADRDAFRVAVRANVPAIATAALATPAVAAAVPGAAGAVQQANAANMLSWLIREP